MFQVFYDLPSKGSFRSAETAPRTNDLNEVKSLLKELNSKADVISIYSSDNQKINICLSEEKEFVLEIITANGIWFKDIDSQEILTMLPNMTSVLLDPFSFDFESESL